MMEQFHYTSKSGSEIVLPHVSKIKTASIRKHRKLPDMDMLFSIIEDVVDDGMLAKIDDLEQGELEDFLKKWQEGASLGESSGSST